VIVEATSGGVNWKPLADGYDARSQFSLAQNYPNPFSSTVRSRATGNPSATIKYALPKNAEVRLVIFNAFGQKVRTLVDRESKEPGSYAVEWDGRNDAGQSVATGVYFYKLTTKDYVRTMKMLLIKSQSS
jgi:hypothetical protein